MATAQYVPNSRADIRRRVEMLAAATRAEDAVDAAGAYLSGWSRDRIWNLQKIDGGWGPFDPAGRPEPMVALADITRVANAMRRQRLALDEAGIEPTPELVELDLFFAHLSRQVADIAHPPSPGAA